jgi:hypothetical protein
LACIKFRFLSSPHQARSDTEIRDEKRDMMFAPWPTGKRGAGKVRAEQNKPEIEPRRSVNAAADIFREENARFKVERVDLNSLLKTDPRAAKLFTRAAAHS